jgi:hypothetical protein
MRDERRGEAMKFGAFFLPIGNHIAAWRRPEAQSMPELISGATSRSRKSLSAASSTSCSSPMRSQCATATFRR